MIICINHNDKILFLIISCLFLLQHFLVDFVSSQESQMSLISKCHKVKTWPNGHNFISFSLDCHSVIVREIETVSIKAEGNEIMTIWSSLDLKAFGYEDHQTLLRRNKVHKKMLKKKLTHYEHKSKWISKSHLLDHLVLLETAFEYVMHAHVLFSNTAKNV